MSGRQNPPKFQHLSSELVSDTSLSLLSPHRHCFMTTQKKSSVSKGRRARALMELDRVWGEGYDKDDVRAVSSRVRNGTSRLGRPYSNSSSAAEGSVCGVCVKEKKRVEKRMRHEDEIQNKGGAWTTEPFLPPLLAHSENIIDNSTDEDEDKNDRAGSYSCMTTLLKRIEGQRRSTTMTTLRELRVGDCYDASSGDEPPSDRDLDSIYEQGVAVSAVGLECDVSPDKKRRVAMENDSDDSFGCTTDSEVAATTAIMTSSATVAEDPYDVHFLGRPRSIEDSGLPSSPLQQTNGLTIVIPASALPRFDPQSSSLFEVCLSGRLQSAWEKCVRDCRGLKFTDAWMEFASGLYHYNRGVLNCNWEANALAGRRESRNKGSGGENVKDGCTLVAGDKKRMMTSLQMTIYPAISRYADVLITSETHEVRKSEIY